MIEKPILLKTWEVQAILDNRKTQKRIVVNPQPKENHIYKLGFITDSTDKTRIGKYSWGISEYGGAVSLARPPYQVGDILWIKETWTIEDVNKFDLKAWIGYKAEGNTQQGYQKQISVTKEQAEKYESNMIDYEYRPSIHMPKEAARIWLKVTDVKVDRLQNITEEQARMEGVNKSPFQNHTMRFADKETQNKNMSEPNYINGFKEMWFDNLPKYYTDSVAWSGNPWVWVITFERIDKQ